MQASTLRQWLRETDADRLTELYGRADAVRRAHVGDSVHLRGLVEISNHCTRQCLYCGIRAGRSNLPRYRMTAAEILDCAELAEQCGYGTVVMQAGEDPGLTLEFIAEVIRAIKARTPLAVTLSLGERSLEELRAWRQAGADRYLMRFETSNAELYGRIHPARYGQSLNRLDLLAEIRRLDYEVGSGIMVGIPGQTYDDLVQDLMLFPTLDLDMIGVGPYLADPETPLGQSAVGAEPDPAQVPATADMTCRVIALARLLCPQANIPSTTALATLDPATGREKGLERGANVVMPNLTPVRYRKLYAIYPDKACVGETAEMCQACLAGRIRRIGRTIGAGRGDSPNKLQRLVCGQPLAGEEPVNIPLREMTLSEGAVDFIDEAYLGGLLAAGPADPGEVRALIAKSLTKQALTVAETAVLLRADAPELTEEIFEAARQLKRDVYGNRIVLFAPLYIGNHCVNDCGYCAFRKSNAGAIRRTLDEGEVVRQVEALEKAGHKRLILVFGEDARYDAEFIAEMVRTVYRTKVGKGEIRRVNINAAPLDIESYRTVKAAGIGTYQVFQETYHHETYRRYHPMQTRKGDYLYRLDALSRAQEAGIDDVGVGALFGLYDWRFEVLGLVSHALHMQGRYGVGPHTMSFPRIRPAHGIELDNRYLVSDHDFKRVIAILRLAVPYTGLILTARENAELRREVMAFGVSQIDAGTRLELGGYTEAGDAQCMEREQFQLGDVRSLDQVMGELLEDGYIPSFCTACYRLGRTGEHFMEFAIPGFIEHFCTPNGLATLQEYLVDYATPVTRAAGERLIDVELTKLPDSKLKGELLARLEQIRTTQARDLYF